MTIDNYAMYPPQPISEPYSKGDEVTVYVGEDDPDVRYHGVKCIVTDRLQDDLNTETGRDRDQYLYRVKRRSTGEVLPIDFRHGDLVPTTTLEEPSSEDDY